MTLYYFLGTLLPELKIGEEPEIRLVDFLSLLKQNLSPHDYSQVTTLLRWIDIENMRERWLGRAIDENALQNDLSALPNYVLQFLDQFDTASDRLKHFSALIAAFFREEIARHTGFLREWLIQERNIRLVLSAIRAKKMKRSILEEMQHQDPQDPLVRDILAQKDTVEYTPPLEYEELAAIYDKYQEDPLKLHQAFLEYRFEKLEEILHLQVFTANRIIAYLFQLFLVEKWLKLDEVRGQNIINSILGVL